jgi:hypothetical protein
MEERRDSERRTVGDGTLPKADDIRDLESTIPDYTKILRSCLEGVLPVTHQLHTKSGNRLQSIFERQFKFINEHAPPTLSTLKTIDEIMKRLRSEMEESFKLIDLRIKFGKLREAIAAKID